MTGDSRATVTRWVVMGDVGGAGGFHVGDEAMLSANIDLLRAALPAVRITAPSAAPGFTRAKYDVDAVPVERLATYEGAAGVLRGADGLLISGGGNLHASWRHHVRSRVALMRVALERDLPVVVTGQGIGPELHDMDSAALAQVLPRVALLGVRDARSHRLARALGVPAERLRYQPDDAYGLVSPPAGDPGRRIVVSLHPFCDPVHQAARFGLLVDQLAVLSRDTGLPLRFVPQVGFDSPAGGRGGDGGFGRALARALADRAAMEVLPIADVATSPSEIVDARLVVSSRYHPVVFAGAAAVPAIALAVDPYTEAKLHGALQHVGRPGDAMWIDEALSGRLAAHGASLIEESNRPARLAAAAACHRRWEDHRTAVASILRGARSAPAVAPPAEGG